VGGTLLGLWGMLIAIPVVATIKILAIHYWDTRMTWPPKRDGESKVEPESEPKVEPEPEPDGEPEPEPDGEPEPESEPIVQPVERC
jgi:hypothetical protein